MTQHSKPSPEQILQARADNPKARERDFAQSLGISEADFVAAHCGLGDDAAISLDDLCTKAGRLDTLITLRRTQNNLVGYTSALIQKNSEIKSEEHFA